MADTMVSLDMSLPIPVVGVDLGPDWALNLNSCLTIIDSHNHTAGNGVQITPNGLNINSDLSFGINNATLLRSVRFSSQSAVLVGASDLGCIYESGVDLYYRDGSGNNIRITQAGGVAGTAGSISNMTSPASASYVAGSSTFVWQSAANTPANMDNASVILRNLTLNSKGLTLSPPNAMGSDFSIILPSLPGSQSILTLDNSGNMATPVVYPIPTAGIANGAIDSTKIAAGSINLVTQAFTSSGTWTAPTGVTKVIVYGFGGGGSGALGTNGSGGGGSTLNSNTFTVVPATVYTVTIGAGGVYTSGSGGQPGGDSSFNGFLFKGGVGASGGGGASTATIAGYTSGGATGASGQGTFAYAGGVINGANAGGGGAGGGGAGANGGSAGAANTGAGGGGNVQSGGSGLITVCWVA